MNNDQSLRFSSFRGTEEWLKTNPAVAGIAGLAPRVARLSANNAEIHAQATRQLYTPDESVVLVDQTLETLSRSTLTIAGIVAAHAAAAQLPDIAREVDLAPGSFRRLRKQHRPWVAQKVHDAAQRLLADLAAYEVTEEMLAAFQAEIDRAKEILSQPRLKRAARRKATARLQELFKETAALLDQEIDRLLVPLLTRDAAFAAQYASVRRVTRIRRGREVSGRKAAVTAASPAPAANPATTEAAHDAPRTAKEVAAAGAFRSAHDATSASPVAESIAAPQPSALASRNTGSALEQPDENNNPAGVAINPPPTFPSETARARTWVLRSRRPARLWR